MTRGEYNAIRTHRTRALELDAPGIASPTPTRRITPDTCDHPTPIPLPSPPGISAILLYCERCYHRWEESTLED